MKKKRILILVLALMAMVPAYAVLNEKDLSQTLSVLRYELRSAYRAMEERTSRMMGRGNRQHAQLVQMMQRSNELSLMLYSQKQDYTFDMTYALNEVSRQYEEFSSRKLPFDDLITRLDIDIDRYDRLIHTLKRLPPAQLMAYRDSTHYAETAALLKSTYDYAQQRYKTVQNKIFIEGQTDYVSLIKSFRRYWQQAVTDARDKYLHCLIHSLRSFPRAGLTGSRTSSRSNSGTRR